MPDETRDTTHTDSAAIVLRCSNLDETLEFFLKTLHFRLDMITPADHPAVAEVSGHGLRLRLEHGEETSANILRMDADSLPLAEPGKKVLAPNGTQIQFVDTKSYKELPPLRPSFVLTKGSSDTSRHLGRAGMRYRDLIPGRQGGRFIASHIHIPVGGPVPDYVHYHDVRFQVIYCHRGWVRVVYEDQGDPFVMQSGDCVLQPPLIRHRVLECSPGLEVIEVGCPAEHPTFADHELLLPTGAIRPNRKFCGQRFVRHVAKEATWQGGILRGFEVRDTGIHEATGGTGSVRMLRPSRNYHETAARLDSPGHSAELLLHFVVRGGLRLHCEASEGTELVPGDAFVVPAGMPYTIADRTPDLELLEVTVG